MLYGFAGSANPTAFFYGRTHPRNHSMVDDPVINEQFVKINQDYFNEEYTQSLVREMTPHILEGCWTLGLPSPYLYTGWWPWVKGYNGEQWVGYFNNNNYPKYIWHDSDLKKEMTGK